MYIISCWIEHPVRSLDRPFTYLSIENIVPGCRIRVPFGRNSLIGFVESSTFSNSSEEELAEKTGYKLKYVQEVIDHQPLITPELHELALWMRSDTLSTAISCFQTMLPSKVKPSSHGEKKIAMERWVRVSGKEVSLTIKQMEAYSEVAGKGEIRYAELRHKYPSIAKVLVDKGALLSYTKEKTADNDFTYEKSVPPVLSEEQAAALKEIEEGKDTVYLVHGATGSGKTELYLQLAADVLKQGKQVLILVPEIALTPQMIERVSSRFGNDLAIYHSGLNDQQKYEQYRQVYTGKAAVVVGTRSAVFLPFQSLGLIVMDEEHDTSYKQENQPSYHCRDIAIWRGKYHHCKVILGSATPSLDSYARALKHVYHLITLKHRINHSLPEVSIVPMQMHLKKGESAILSPELQAKIRTRLDEHEQVILLLNRRGYNTLLRCRNCGKVIQCPHCDLAMSWHRDVKRLKCHACGYEMRLPHRCPECDSTDGFATFGYGTEKLEEEVHHFFPEARILRMDADTTSRKDAHEKILSAFGTHQADILVGTQMIAKGLDYPDVTLVGVVNGDEGLNRTDYRSCETTFDLLMQAGGRSGRAGKKGEVVYQVYNPDHYAVQCAARQDYVSFFKEEMKFRHAGMYPPYTYLISLTIIGNDQSRVDHLAMVLKEGLHGSFKTIGVLSLLRIQDKVRDRILLKGQNMEEMKQAVRSFLADTKEDMKGLRIDTNPMVLDE